MGLLFAFALAIFPVAFTFSPGSHRAAVTLSPNIPQFPTDPSDIFDSARASGDACAAIEDIWMAFSFSETRSYTHSLHITIVMRSS
jgi:hypothetical protein